MRRSIIKETTKKQLFISGGNPLIPFEVDKLDVGKFLYSNNCGQTYRLLNDREHLIDIETISRPEFSIKDPSLLIETKVKALQNFCKYIEKKNIPFLYFQSPSKISPLQTELPIANNNNMFATALLKKISKSGIDYIDYREILIKNDNFLESFFKTDHHWKPSAAFSATRTILNKIKEETLIDFDFDKMEINNYNTTIFEKIFLGSHGRSTGILFSEPENFELIEPKFVTDYELICDNINYYKKGTTRESLFLPTQLNWDFYKTNPYAVYNLVESAYTIIKNRLAYNNKKILFIRDSFINPIGIFIAPHFKEIHSIDLRQLYPTRSQSNKKDLFEIIDTVKFDIIVMSYFPREILREQSFDIDPYI